MQVSMPSSTITNTYTPGQGSNSYLGQQNIAKTQQVESGNQSTVHLSVQAQMLNAQSNNPSTQPVSPINDKHKETAKAIAAYNMVSNLGDDNISMTEAHLIKNNDTARQFYVGKDMLEHQADMADAYIDSMSTEEEEN